MVSIPKIISVISCGVVLSLSLANATQARMGPDPCADRKGGLPNLLKCDEEMRQGVETIKGEVLRVGGENYVVERVGVVVGVVDVVLVLVAVELATTAVLVPVAVLVLVEEIVLRQK